MRLYLFSSLSSVSMVFAVGDSGCTAKSHSFSYNPSHAISYYCGSAASSFFSSWVCGEDRHISKVSWSASSSFLLSPSHYLFFFFVFFFFLIPILIRFNIYFFKVFLYAYAFIISILMVLPNV